MFSYIDCVLDLIDLYLRSCRRPLTEWYELVCNITKQYGIYQCIDSVLDLVIARELYVLYVLQLVDCWRKARDDRII